jgi:C4-dicarboxylate-binding protein DctP
MKALKFAAVLLTVFAAGLAVPPSAFAEKYRITWLLGHKNLDYFEEAAVSFKSAVEIGSHGDIRVDIVTKDEDKGAALAPASPEIAALVAKGKAEMGHSFTDVMGSVDPRYYAFEAPYLFRGYRHMEGVIEGSVGEGMLAALRDRGIVGLSFTYSGGASGVATKDRPLRGPADLKGLKVGVYGDRVNETWLKALGASPVAVEHRLESIVPLSRDGALDAAVTTWRNFDQAKLQKGFRYFSLPGSTYLVSVTYINAKFYDGLPEKYRVLIRDASKEAARIERAKTIELNEDAKRQLLSRGVRPVALPEAGRTAFDAALRPAYEGPLAEILGKDLLENIRATPDGSIHPTMPTEFTVR